MPAPTVLTTCMGQPGQARDRGRRRRRRKKQRREFCYIGREPDAGPVEEATLLTSAQADVIQGFPFTYKLTVGDTKLIRSRVGKFIDNARCHPSRSACPPACLPA